MNVPDADADGTVTGTNVGTDTFTSVGGFVLGAGADTASVTAGLNLELSWNGRQGNDTITGGTVGKDTYWYHIINDAAGNPIATNDAGNGHDTITNFSTNKDATLDANEDLLKFGGGFFITTTSGAVTTANLSAYMQLSGSSTLQVDRDGAGATYSMTSVATLTGVSLVAADLQNMLTAGQIVVL